MQLWIRNLSGSQRLFNKILGEKFMKKLGLFVAVMITMLCMVIGACASNVDLDNDYFFTDKAFRAYLLKFDKDGDRALNDEEAEAVTCIDVTNLGVKAIDGLFLFTELKELYCGNNEITSLFTGNNMKLKVLSCENNKLTSLGLTGNYNLEKLNCSGNELTSLDVSSAYCYLTILECENNKITDLDISECYDLVKVIIKNKPKEYDTYYSWDGGESGHLNVDKTVNLITGIDTGIAINDTNFQVVALWDYIYRKRYNGDGVLSDEEIERITSIDVVYEKIKSLKGIEFFPNLKKLNCHGNSITSLDLTANTKLEEIDCYGCPVESLEVSQCKELKSLNCSWTKITTLNVRENALLEKLICWYLPLGTIDLSKNTKLKELECLHCDLNGLDLSYNPELTYLDCRENNLTKLELNTNTELTKIRCSDNQLTELDLRNNTKLRILMCSSNKLTSLDTSNSPGLWEIYCDNNQLTRLNTENNDTLFAIWCCNNQLTTLDVSKNPKLDYFNCCGNKLAVIDISKCPGLIGLMTNGTRHDDDNIFLWNRDNSEAEFRVNKGVRIIPAAVENIYLNYSNLDMYAGDSKMLTGVISPLYAGNQNIRWASNHPEIATVDSDGQVRAVAAGSAIISVTTEDGGKTAECTVTVFSATSDHVPVTGVMLNKAELMLSEGDTEALIATISPVNATNRNIVWSSSNNGIVTVDANGKVTAVSSGRASITVTTEDAAKTACCTVTVEPRDKVEAFVTRCYSIILGRKPDAAGFADWTTALRNKTKTASEIIYGFVGSNEFKNKNYSCSDTVEILYKAMLGRGSDAKGKEYWVTKLEDGQPVAAAINGFCASNEFQRICREYGITPGSVKVDNANEAGNGNNGADNPRILTSAKRTIKKEKAEEFVRRCYKLILGREADQGGLDNWTGILTDGQMTLEQVANSFFSSAEFINRNLDSDAQVKILYKVYLNRDADQEGLAAWTEKLNNGTTLQELLKAFSKTSEFKAIISSMIE